MDFDSRIAEHLQGLRFSTWYISGDHIAVTAPTAYVLQGLQVHPALQSTEPRGVVLLHAPGPYASRYITALRAVTAQALAAERQRLQRHLGDGWQASILDAQLPVASAAMRGGIQEPAEVTTSTPQEDLPAQVVPVPDWRRRAG